MIVLKIIGIAVGFVLASVWLGAVISAGVTVGLNRYFENYSKEK